MNLLQCKDGLIKMDIFFCCCLHTVWTCEDINNKAEPASLQQISWCNSVKVLNWAVWFACEIIWEFLLRRDQSGRVTVVSVSADRSRPRGFSARFMFTSSSKQRGNHSGANYSPLQHTLLQLTLLNFSCGSVFDKSNGGCRASWITFTHVVDFVSVASGSEHADTYCSQTCVIQSHLHTSMLSHLSSCSSSVWGLFYNWEYLKWDRMTHKTALIK